MALCDMELMNSWICELGQLEIRIVDEVLEGVRVPE